MSTHLRSPSAVRETLFSRVWRHISRNDDRRRRVMRESNVPCDVQLLESRVMLTLGNPTWTEQGPGPSTDGQVEGLGSQSNPVAGAIESIAAHPTNADIIVVGTINGGLWTTTNATSPFPNWTPRSDQLPSLAISDVAFSPSDPNIVYAGTGSFSSGASDGGDPAGVYRSTDGGQTWTQLGGPNNTFAQNNQRIRDVMPTTLDGGNVVLVGAIGGGGIYRSTDGGTTFTQLSGDGSSGLPAGLSATHLVADPADPNRFYAAIGIGGATQGVYRSDDGGATWTRMSTGITTHDGNTARTELAIHFNTTNNTHAIYAATIGFNGQLSGLFRSTDMAGNWAAMDVPAVTEAGGTTLGLHPGVKDLGGPEGSPSYNPGSQGRIHFSMAADLDDPNVVFVGGDRQPSAREGGGTGASFPNAIGANNFTGRLFRGDASLATGSQFVHVTHSNTLGPTGGGANGSAPHADSRDMVFDANGNILEADDGGIYRLINPNTPATRRWESVIGNIRVTEFYSTAYNTVANQIWGGTQDVGTSRQTAPGNIQWETWIQGDGGVVQVDNTSTPGSAIVYSSFQRFGFFNRSTVDPAGNIVANTAIGLIVNGSGNQTLRAVDANVQFIQPYVLNAIDPTRMLIGTAQLYESFDQGDTLDDLGGFNGSFVSAMAYGGRTGGVDNPDVIYAGLGNELMLRTTAGGTLNTVTTYTGGTIRDISLDPDDWQTVYIVDSAGRVFRSTDAGATAFTDITGTLNTMISDIRTVEVFANTTALADEVVFIGGLGGVFGTDNGGASWSEFGTSLPNVLVRDLDYDTADDLLLAGTWGRGAWTVSAVSTFVGVGGESLTLSFAPTSFSENSGTAIGTVTRTGPVTGALVVTLASGDLTEATVPATVTISTGAAFATFTVTGVDDPVVDGNQIVTITGSSSGFTTGTNTVIVLDDDNNPPPSALYLNEVLIDPDGVSDNPNEYIELRGTPGEMLQGVYVLLVEGDGIANAGTIDRVISLHGTSIGTNGFIAIMDAANAPYAVATGTTIVDIPGLDFENASYSVLLVHVASGSAPPPVAGQDLDTGDDGLDPLPSSWNLLDGVSALDGGSSDRSYAPITFSADADGAVEPGSLLVNTGFGPDDVIYLMRIGNSTGSLSSDWAAFELDENSTLPDWEIEGSTSSTFFVGAIVTNHLGATNPSSALVEMLTISVAPPSISENGGTATGTVRRMTGFGSGITNGNLVVTLNSSDTGEAIVPVSVTIPDGRASTTFTVIGIDDAIADGTQTVTLSASAAGIRDDDTTIDVTDDDIAAVIVTISPATMSENGGTAIGTVTRNSPTTGALTVMLTSSDPGEAVVPVTVVIPANSATATFIVTGIDDAIVDGTQIVTVTPMAGGHTSVPGTVDVTDDDGTAGLTVTINPASINENGGTAIGTVFRNTGTSGDLSVSLNSADTGEASVPSSVTIPDGSDTATFTITGVDDTIADGTQQVAIVANTIGFTDGNGTIDVTDDDGPAALSVSINQSAISENGGTAIGTVTRNSGSAGALVVGLSSDDIGEAIVPANVTIPDGSVSATFLITAVDDAILDGTQTVTVTATSVGFVDGAATLDVTDDEVPPTTTEIIDNADPEFSTVGRFLLAGGGYLGNTRYTPDAGHLARWHFSGIQNGQYQFAATWRVTSLNTAAATYAASASIGGATLGSGTVDQRSFPNDFTDVGVGWENIAVVNVTGNVLVVELPTDGSGRFFADAIRIERLGDVVLGPEIEVLDGTIDVPDGSGPIDIAGPRTFTVRNTGTSDLIVNPVTLTGSGFAITGNFTPGQVIAPLASASFTVEVTAPGAMGTLSFVTNDGDENPFNFDVRQQDPVRIIDDGDAGFSTNGTFAKASGGHQKDVRFTSGNQGKTATWSFIDLPDGLYRVSTSWRVTTVNATNVPYTILTSPGGTVLGTATIDQSQAAGDLFDQGTWFEDLGTVSVTGSTLAVMLSDTANGRVFADAVRLERVGDVPPPSPSSGNLVWNGGDDDDEGFAVI